MFEGTLFDLSGKAVLVTGGSRGIGAATCRRMAQHGAKVVVSSRKIEACDALAAEINAQGGEAFAHPCNIARKEDLQALVDATLTRWGRIDVLVCNAAVNTYLGPAIGMPDDAFDKVMATNVRSTLWLSHMVLPHMAARGSGSVIIMSSIGGFRGNTALGAYSISKAADMQIARNLAVEWGPKGIRANCLAPGLVRTDGTKMLWSNEPLLRKRTADSPLQRIGEADEIAGAAVFLASPASTFMTGQTIVIDGGVLAGPPDVASQD